MAVMRLASAYWGARVIHTAQRFDIFTRLEEHAASARDLAEECLADRRGMEILLIACTALGFLHRRRDGRYANGPLAKTFLVKGAPRYQGGIVSMFDSWYSAWERLPEAVQMGKPVVEKPHDQGPEALRAYIYGMHYRGLPQGKLLAEKINLSDRRRLLDVAGGPGTFSILFCQKNKNLSATVFDLPQTLEITREIIAQFAMEGRVETKAGSYLADSSFGKGYDVVLLSSMFNQESPETVRRILARSHDALEPGGLAIVQEQLLASDKSGPLLAALIGVNQLIHTPGGAAYSSREMSEWMKGAGFRSVRVKILPPPSPFTVVMGVKR